MVPQLIAAAAVGALTPQAILATIVLLGSERPVANTLALLAGWTLVLVTLGVVLLLILGPSSEGAGTSAKAAVSLVVGLLLLGVAVRDLVVARHPVIAPGLPKAGEAPGWMTRVEHLHPAGAFVVGALLITISPADVGVFIPAVQALIGEELGVVAGLGLFAVLVVCIDACIVVPLAVYLLMPRRAAGLLAGAKRYFLTHQRVVNGASAGLFGLLLVGSAITSLPD